MNSCLGIKSDKDILKGGFSPSQETLDLWEADEQGEGPVLNPMKPSWINLDSSWNHRLEEMFSNYFCEKMNMDDGEFEDDVRDMFRQRLVRLRRLLKGGSPRAGENLDQMTVRVQKTSAAALARQRPNSRRREVSDRPMLLSLRSRLN